MAAELAPVERKRRILVAEDEPNPRKVMVAHLRRAGYDIVEAVDAPSACEAFLASQIDCVLTDLKMSASDDDGLAVLRFVGSHSPLGGPGVPVIILTAFGTADKAVDALAQGAYNLISKPCDMPELLTQVQNAIREREEALMYAVEADASPGRFGMIGRTPAMQRLFDMLETVANSPSTVLITGESGTGKELVARALHQHSSRSRQPFVAVNCAAIPDQLLESELFGHERGAFTGAVATKPGRLEHADRGTLFLDEIGELRQELQVKLLRCIQEQEFERVGGLQSIRVDVRFVVATHRDLAQEVREGRFREDLYYRLKVVPITLPPLRERRDDIPQLAEHFIQKYNRRLGRNVAGMDRTLLEALQRYVWPGNIRELENVIERMVLFAGSSMLGIRQLPSEILTSIREAELARAAEVGDDSQEEATWTEVEATATTNGASFKQRVREETNRLERDIILKALASSGWNVTRTAEALGLSRKGLQMKIKELDIRKSGS